MLALQTGKMGLDQFMENMTERRVPKKRREDVLKALETFAQQGVFAQVSTELF